MKQLLQTRFFKHAKPSVMPMTSQENPSDVSFGADENLESSSDRQSLSPASLTQHRPLKSSGASQGHNPEANQGANQGVNQENEGDVARGKG